MLRVDFFITAEISPMSFGESLVNVVDGERDRRPPKWLRGGERRFSKPCPEVSITPERRQRVGKRPDISRGYQDSGNSVFNRKFQATDPRGDHRCTARHCFDRDEAK